MLTLEPGYNSFNPFYIQVGARDATFNEFIDAVKQKDGSSEDCRYAILDYEFTLEAQGTEASQRYVQL